MMFLRLHLNSSEISKRWHGVRLRDILAKSSEISEEGSDIDCVDDGGGTENEQQMTVWWWPVTGSVGPKVDVSSRLSLTLGEMNTGFGCIECIFSGHC